MAFELGDDIIRSVLDGLILLDHLLLYGAFPATAAAGLISLACAIFSRRIPRLVNRDGPELVQYPKVSVIIPACNEALTLEAALGTLLDEDYPNLEIVLIDDRSTDATYEVIQRLAARDARVKPVRVTSLPEGWLGKVNALMEGTKRATGEWLLFTDADVHFATGTLRRVLRLALDKRLDHVSIAPSFVSSSVWLRVMILAFGALFLLGARPDRLGEGSSEFFVGVGAFNLVRREAYDRSEGFDFLKMEVADDVGLGLLIHRAGGRCAFYGGEGFIKIEWYDSVRAMMAGLEKNLFGVSMGWSQWQFLLKAPVLFSIVVGPWVALAQMRMPWLSAFAMGSLLLSIGASVVASRRLGLGNVAGCLVPIGSLLVFVTLLRSAILTWKRGGIVWRGTFYPMHLLRNGQRVTL